MFKKLKAFFNKKNAKKNNKHNSLDLAKDIITCIMAAAIVAFAFHFFANYNNFAPGGINGIASMIGYLTKTNMAYFLVMLNLPIFLAVYFLVNKKTAIMLIVYMSFQAIFLYAFDMFNITHYVAENSLIFAAIGTGVVSGFGFSMMLKRFGASGGTYAISSIIRRFYPEKNLAWVSFFMDSSVVLAAIFVYNFNVESIMCTLINLFIANVVVDYFLSGLKKAVKFEIITENTQEICKEILENLHTGITKIQVVGAYSEREKSLLICIVRKRFVGDFLRLIKKYNTNFSYMSYVNEVFENSNYQII